MGTLQKYSLQNLDCSKCALDIEQTIQKINGVTYINVNAATATMLIDADDFSVIEEAIHKIEPNIRVQKFADKGRPESLIDIQRELLPLIISSVFFILGLIFYKGLAATQFRLGEYLVFGFAYLISGWEVLSRTLKDVIKGKLFDENFLMTIATLGAIAIGELPEAVGVMLFYNLGEFIQGLSVKRSRRSIRELLEIRPDTATRINDGDHEKVHPDSVRVGDLLLVKPGEKIPLDGEIISGGSQIDNSLLTGESYPYKVGPGDSVMAGSINKSGLITISTTQLLEHSTIHRILELVEVSTSRKAKTEKFITKFANIYSPIVVLISIGVALIPPIFLNGSFSDWGIESNKALRVSCPCALVISIPLGYFGGVGGASRRGILVKGSNFLDILASVKTVVFDKTGTLTKGEFNVTRVIPKNGYSEDDLLKYAVQAEAGSNHPIADSIRRHYGKTIQGEIQEFQEIAGHGIQTIIDGRVIIAGNDPLLHEKRNPHDPSLCKTVGTVVHIAVDQEYAGCIQISDELKEDTAAAMDQIRSTGVEKLVMLTGDHSAAAEGIADSLSLDSFNSGLNPEGKLSELEEIISMNANLGTTAFVGDGVNDAPSLARADVGIAMGALGSEAAIETADVVITDFANLKVAEAIQIGKKTKRIVWQNIGMALIIKAGFIIFGIIGEASMWHAVFGDMGVALLAVFNSTRARH